MKPIRLVGWAICACLALAGCGDGKSDPKAEAPPALKLQSAADENVFEADRPEQFALITAGQHMAARQLRVTGTVAPDVSRSVPVVSVATGRVVAINARLGDTVKKGQLLLRLQSADLSGAFSDYRRDYRSAGDERERDSGAGRAKPFHHFGLELGVDSLRRLRKRFE